MPGHDIIVVGFSAGCVEALAQPVCALPRDLQPSLIVPDAAQADLVSAGQP